MRIEKKVTSEMIVRVKELAGMRQNMLAFDNDVLETILQAINRFNGVSEKQNKMIDKLYNKYIKGAKDDKNK